MIWRITFDFLQQVIVKVLSYFYGPYKIGTLGGTITLHMLVQGRLSMGMIGHLSFPLEEQMEGLSWTK